ncbi:MAG: hypothetical protein IJR97_04295 [Clostridia bacterium]|nr:hypothetical protein [Clostridia bacterium]
MAKKKKARLNWKRRGMTVLGWFHYLSAFFQLLLGFIGILGGVHLLGARLRAELPQVLAFLSAYNDTALGVFMIIRLVIGVAAQFILGRIWCRKARTTANQMLAMILSGGKIISVLFAILSGGILNAEWANIHALILNSVSFSLAFWLHREYRKTGLHAADAPEKDGTESAGESS